jgi:hypothetical protein
MVRNGVTLVLPMVYCTYPIDLQPFIKNKGFYYDERGFIGSANGSSWFGMVQNRFCQWFIMVRNGAKSVLPMVYCTYPIDLQPFIKNKGFYYDERGFIDSANGLLWFGIVQKAFLFL